MNAETSALVRIAVALGTDDHGGLARALSSAHTVARAAAVDEMLLQSFLFVGYPRVLNAFRVWRTIEPAAAPAPRDEIDFAERGRMVLSRVYGGQGAKVVENVEALHPDLARWMVEEGYGRVLGRGVLDLGVRELCIIALLATQDAVPQLHSHLRGALNAGAPENDVEEALALALSGETFERTVRARETWETVRSRRGG